MKKSLVVLLIAVLAVSSVFAGITGYVDVKYTVNFDKGEFAYTKPALGDKLKAQLKFDNIIGAKKGNGKAYIDASAALIWNINDYKDHNYARTNIASLGYFQFLITKFSIVAKDWSINLIEPEKLGNFGSSTLDFHTWYRHDHMNGYGVNDKDTAVKAASQEWDWGNKTTGYETGTTNIKVTYRDDYAEYAKKVAYGASYSYYDEEDNMDGFTVAIKDWKVAAAANGKINDKDATERYMFGLQTPTFKYGTFTTQVAAGFTYRKNSNQHVDKTYAIKDRWVIGASLKFTTKTDKFAASLATDQTIIASKTNDTGKNTTDKPFYNGDILVKAEFAPVSTTVFFAKEAVSKKGYDKSYQADVVNGVTKTYKYYFSTQGNYKSNTVDNLLSFEVASDLKKYDIPFSIKVQGLNMISKMGILNASVKLGFVKNVDIEVYGKDLLASKTRIADKYDAEKGTGAWNYWDENGSKQKLGVKATFKASKSVTLNGELYAQIAKDRLGAKVGVEYRANVYTLYGSIDTRINWTEAKKHSDSRMQLIAGAKSDKLVDGAALSVEYKSGNILNNDCNYDWQVGQIAGKLTAKCRVTF